MSPEATAVVSSFVAAYEPYLDAAMQAQDLLRPPGWTESVEEGRAWLEASLRQLLSQPLDAQPRSPLEVFQASMRFPTEVLRAAGVEPVERDEMEHHALPGDLYRLAPASSRDLGEDAWRAHLGWGVAKARRVGGAVAQSEPPRPVPRRPTVALVGNDLMDRSRVEAAAQHNGLLLAVWRNPAAVEAGLVGALPVVALVDLRHPTADNAIRALAEAGVRCIAFGPHVDDVALVRAQSLGAVDALPRSRFFKRLPELLPKQA